MPIKPPFLSTHRGLQNDVTPKPPPLTYTSYTTTLTAHRGPKPWYAVPNYKYMTPMVFGAPRSADSPLEWGVLQGLWQNCTVLLPDIGIHFLGLLTQYFELEGETGLVGKLFERGIRNCFQILTATFWQSTVSKRVQLCCPRKSTHALSSQPSHAQGEGMSVAHDLWILYGSSMHTYYP